jgi:hypothetical protein
MQHRAVLPHMSLPGLTCQAGRPDAGGCWRVCSFCVPSVAHVINCGWCTETRLLGDRPRGDQINLRLTRTPAVPDHMIPVTRQAPSVSGHFLARSHASRSRCRSGYMQECSIEQKIKRRWMHGHGRPKGCRRPSWSPGRPQSDGIVPEVSARRPRLGQPAQSPAPAPAIVSSQTPRPIPSCHANRPGIE